jgi:hypothetical protein
MKHPGLNIPGPVGPGEQEVQQIAARWNTQPLVEAELASEGFYPMSQPEHVLPRITNDLLTSPNNKDYTEAYNSFVAWLGYTRDKLARTQLALLQMKNQKKELERTLRGRIFGMANANNQKKPTIKEQEDYIEADATYADLMVRMQHQQQKELVYQSEFERFSDAVKLMSRNVEIRRGHWEAEGGHAGQPYQNPYPGMPGRLR